MGLHYDGEVRIFKLECGNWGNNAYIVADPKTGDSVIIDTPPEPEKVLAQAQGLNVKAILITHSHSDHLVGFQEIRSQTGSPVWIHPDDAHALPNPPEHPLEHGEIMQLGSLELEVIHTPGHTPGATCYRVGKHLFSGDTLFPGGPGHSNSPASLHETISSITERLFSLADDTVVYPGHGGDTDIATAKAEYQVFANKPHSPDLYGDVLWLES